ACFRNSTDAHREDSAPLLRARWSDRMRRWSAILGLVLAAALLAWHGVAKPLPGDPRTVPAARRLVIGVRSDVTSLNIYTAASAFDQEIADLLYPKLA